MKVLNLYAGIGGNRKLWKDVKVTAVEIDLKIAKIYIKNFPGDEVIIGDAHQYLLEHYHEFDFIWSSPPCPTHSDIRRCGVHRGQNKAVYPDMELYQEIILLQHFAPKRTKWVIENVNPYYTALIKPSKSGRHTFWSNFPITFRKSEEHEIHNNIVGSNEVYGFNIKDTNIEDKRKVLRNLVNPKVGLHIFELAFKKPQQVLFK